MSFPELFLIALGLSMDAFAVSVCQGLSLPRLRVRYALLVGLYFGAFQAVMPLLGWELGDYFQEAIVSVDHWIAFGLLTLLGVNLIREAREKEENIELEAFQKLSGSQKQISVPPTSPHTPSMSLSASKSHTQASSVYHTHISSPIKDLLSPASMLPLALATSIDALAVGVTFAFLEVPILPAVTLIGVTTLFLSMIGTAAGHLFGLRLKAQAEIAGGVILILMGVKVLAEHLLFS